MIELELIQNFPATIIALDEAGRGPVAGPVVVGAIRIDVESAEELEFMIESLRMVGVSDSKKLNSAMRLSILKDLEIELKEFREVHSLTSETKITYVSWEMDHQVIDVENILAASLRGMKEAALKLLDSEEKKSAVYFLIDGHMKLRWGMNENEIKNSVQEFPIIKGDLHSVLIGLASIIGKEKRDEWMHKMDTLYPIYGFKKHFGYPTKKHRELIKTHGPSPIHRLSFKGVKEFV